MPTVQELLTDARGRYPNTQTDAQLINFGNEILRKIWKWMDTTEIYTFATIASQPTYSLPTDGLVIDKILDIEIASDTTNGNYETYKFQGLLVENPLSHYFYDVTPGIFGIYPTPTVTGLDARIFYGKRFTLMGASDTTVIPAVNEDYHSLIVNYMCMKAATSGSNADTARHNDFATAFNDDWKRLMFDWTRKKCKTPIKKRSNPQWR